MRCRKCGYSFDWTKPKLVGDQATHDVRTDRQKNADLRLVAATFKAHQNKAVEFRQRCVERETHARSLNIDTTVVHNVSHQVAAAHRELQWVHMALHFHDCSEPHKSLLLYNVTELEREVEALKASTTLGVSGCERWDVRSIVFKTALVDRLRLTIKRMTPYLV